MKKIAFLLMSACMAVGLSSCAMILAPIDAMGKGLIGSWQNETVQDSKTYTVTFRQFGYEDVVLEVEEGGAITEIPETQPRTGYTVEWEEAYLHNVRSDLVITAVETPNVYTITYNTNGGTLSTLTQEVTYDSQVVLATPTLAGYDFTGWTYNGKSVVDGKWTIAENVTLDAQYAEIIPEFVTVTFNCAGEEPVSVVLSYGASLEAADYPALEQKTGYTIYWDKTLEQLANLTSNTIVTAVEEPKTYTITLDPNGGTLESTTFTVTYGEAYTLPEPHRDAEGTTNYRFTGWTYNGEKVPRSGVWMLDESGREYVATWIEETWTGFH